jgi:hypothetical protein
MTSRESTAEHPSSIALRCQRICDPATRRLADTANQRSMIWRANVSLCPQHPKVVLGYGVTFGTGHDERLDANR